jgi:hypothetical protein
MTSCKRCRYGIPDREPDGTPYIVCALMPPHRGERPLMKPTGWCGQFKLSLKRLFFGHGA